MVIEEKLLLATLVASALTVAVAEGLMVDMVAGLLVVMAEAWTIMVVMGDPSMVDMNLVQVPDTVEVVAIMEVGVVMEVAAQEDTILMQGRDTRFCAFELILAHTEVISRCLELSAHVVLLVPCIQVASLAEVSSVMRDVGG